MSRCFPFPPKGYEKKARTDDVDLLKKEKQREKKHKKEKKDKEKRESKDKREKEGRDGKHREKKDKKEKHREKKKDKDKDRDKDKGRDRDKSKTSSVDDKGITGQAEGLNVGKLHQKEIKPNDKKGTLFEEKPTKQHTGFNGEKARQHNHLAEENKDSKFLMEFDRRIKDDNGGAGNQLAQCTNTIHRKDEGTASFAAKGCGTWPDGNDKHTDKVFDAKKIDGKGILAGARPIANATVKNHVGNFHPRVDGMPRNLEKNKTMEAGSFHHRVDGTPSILQNNFNKALEAKVEGKEKVREKKDEGKEKVKEKKDEAKEKIKENKNEGKEKIKEKKDDNRGEKRKDKEKEKKGHGKDKDRDKEKKKEEKAMGHTEVKTVELKNLKESNRSGPVGLNSFSLVSKNSHENAVSDENPKKRKDVESNGIPRANENLPSKLPRPSSSRPPFENGRISEPCQISIPNASDRPGASPNVKVENKECKINGVIDTRPFLVPSNKTKTVIVPADPVAEASARPPHPDTKYLSQVYSVPKVEEWSGLDDQEWLFGSSISQGRKPAVGYQEAWETQQVWAEGMHIEPADVFALPYVIPY